MTTFNCKREGDPVRDAVKPVLEVMLKKGARQEDVATALQKAQKELVLGCEGCSPSIKTDVLWVHAYVEAEKDLLDEIEREAGKASEISAMCFLYKAAGIAVSDDAAESFYGGECVGAEGPTPWGELYPELDKIKGDSEREKHWLTYRLTKLEAPIFKLWQNADGNLQSDPPIQVHEAYKCVFNATHKREKCVYVHIGYPGRDTELSSHVGPSGCYLLLKDHEAFGNLPPCLVLHIRAFVQTVVTAQLAVLAGHLHQRKRAKVDELEKYHSMYKQLLSPLRSLTDAVRSAQEDAHKIAAIIHDPLDVLLERQSAIAELFIKGEVVEIPPCNASVVVEHEPKDYTDKQDVAAGIAAELLRRLIPELAKNLTATTPSDAFKEIVGRLRDWSAQTENAYSDFCEAFRRFLNTESWNSSLTQNSGHTKSWDGIFTALQNRDQVTGIAIQFLDSAKKRLFTLYKPDEATKALTWEAMRAYLRTIKVEDNSFLEPPDQLGNGMILPKGANPLNTHGSLVAFIGRVVAQHMSYRKLGQLNFTLAQEAQETSFAVQSRYSWLPEPNEFVEFLGKQIEYRAEGARAVREFGDREQPFVDLIERIPPKVEIAADCTCRTLKLSVGQLIFEFSEGHFTMVSKCEVAS